MASNLSPKPALDQANKDTFRAIVGSPTGAKKYGLKTGTQKASEASSCNLMVFGEFGSGKTYLAIALLKLGLKVLYINTDFGRAGYATIRNYFKSHPEDAHLEANIRMPEDDKGKPMDITAVLAFCVDPASVVPDIYEFDPDFLFWDGLTSFQQGDLEDMITGGDILREDTTWKDWRSALNGTIFPMMRFLGQHNERTGKPWHKMVTLLQNTKGKFKPGPTNGQDREIIPGSEKTGPMLHTGARELLGAGFDLVLQTTVARQGKDTTYNLISRGADLLVKDRGFMLPEKSAAGFIALWEEHIGPKVNAVKLLEGTTI